MSLPFDHWMGISSWLQQSIHHTFQQRGPQNRGQKLGQTLSSPIVFSQHIKFWCKMFLLCLNFVGSHESLGTEMTWHALNPEQVNKKTRVVLESFRKNFTRKKVPWFGKPKRLPVQHRKRHWYTKAKVGPDQNIPFNSTSTSAWWQFLKNSHAFPDLTCCVWCKSPNTQSSFLLPRFPSSNWPHKQKEFYCSLRLLFSGRRKSSSCWAVLLFFSVFARFLRVTRKWVCHVTLQRREVQIPLADSFTSEDKLFHKNYWKDFSNKNLFFQNVYVCKNILNIPKLCVINFLFLQVSGKK